MTLRGELSKKNTATVDFGVFSQRPRRPFGTKISPRRLTDRMWRLSPCGHTSSDRDVSGRLQYAEIVHYTLLMSAGTSAAPHAVGVNEYIHTEGQAQGHSRCSLHLFTPSPRGATAVKSEIGSVGSTLPACRIPLETSRDDVGGRHGELCRRHLGRPFGTKKLFIVYLFKKNTIPGHNT